VHILSWHVQSSISSSLVQTLFLQFIMCDCLGCSFWRLVLFPASVQPSFTISLNVYTSDAVCYHTLQRVTPLMTLSPVSCSECWI